ncbi:MAG: tetratricopeptide repeat protein [Kofleriaceae bacterium]
MGDIVSMGIGPRRGFLRGTSATAWYELGCAQEASDPERAIGCYQRALAGRPDHADAHNNLARLIHDRCDRVRAAGIAERASDGGSASVRDRVRADLAMAEAHYRLAICARYVVPLYWFNLAVSVEDQGRIAEAIELYHHALALDASLADAHWNLARLYELTGRRTMDELALRRAVNHLVRYRKLRRVG